MFLPPCSPSSSFYRSIVIICPSSLRLSLTSCLSPSGSCCDLVFLVFPPTVSPSFSPFSSRCHTQHLFLIPGNPSLSSHASLLLLLLPLPPTFLQPLFLVSETRLSSVRGGCRNVFSAPSESFCRFAVAENERKAFLVLFPATSVCKWV